MPKNSTNTVANGEDYRTLCEQRQCNGKHAGCMLAHDWEWEKNHEKGLWDDGTMSFFWRKHSVLVLLMFIGLLVYTGFYDRPDPELKILNTKKGLIASGMFFLLIGVLHTPDGPFRRPHPIVWRLFLCVSILYELILIFLLFQSVEEARHLINLIDPSIDKPQPEKDYGGNCILYDYQNNPDDPWHNITSKMDIFVLIHFLGWWIKTLLMRDFWLSMVISILFEFMEYTFEHQLPNFVECWWDHWILDMICNTAGIYMGLQTLRFLSMREYHWRGVWQYPTLKGKMKRVVAQFGPYVWIDFKWMPTKSLIRWLSMIIVLVIICIEALGYFYIKSILWLPPDHFLLGMRCLMFAGVGAVSMREVFQTMDDPKCNQMGRQTWVFVAIIFTELILCCKYDPGLMFTPLPMHMQIFWAIFALSLCAWTVYWFLLRHYLRLNMKWCYTYLPVFFIDKSNSSSRKNSIAKKQDSVPYYRTSSSSDDNLENPSSPTPSSLQSTSLPRRRSTKKQQRVSPSRESI